MEGQLWAILVAAIGFVCGGLNGALITSKLVYRKDVRNFGSKNAGLTNFYRVFGKNAIILVLFIDIAKTAAPVLLGGLLMDALGTWGAAEERIVAGRLVGGLFAMIGHAYPMFYGFKGGKAVLAGGTFAVILDWRVGLAVLGVFLVSVLATRFVSLGSILAAIALPIAVWGFGYRLFWQWGIAALVAAFIIYRHWENIGRLIRGEERKFSFRRSSERVD